MEQGNMSPQIKLWGTMEWFVAVIESPTLWAISIDLVGVKLLTCFRQGKWLSWPGNATGASVPTAT